LVVFFLAWSYTSFCPSPKKVSVRLLVLMSSFDKHSSSTSGEPHPSVPQDSIPTTNGDRKESIQESIVEVISNGTKVEEPSNASAVKVPIKPTEYFCFFCNLPATNLCVCHKVAYCSRICQSHDRAIHKSDCKVPCSPLAWFALFSDVQSSISYDVRGMWK
jgi:hypothetical protein